MFPAVVPQTTVAVSEVSPAAEFHLSRQLGNHALWPTPLLGLWVLRGLLHTRAQWRRSVLLHAAAGPLTAVLIRSAADLNPIAEELTPAGQPSGRQCQYPRPHLRRRLMGPQAVATHCFNCTALYRTHLPVHRKLIQWLLGPSPSLSATRDRSTVTGPDSKSARTRSKFIQLTVVDDINAKAVEA